MLHLSLIDLSFFLAFNAVQAVYYLLFALTLWLALPSKNVAVQVHVGFTLVAALVFAVISFSEPKARARQTKTGKSNGTN